MKYNIFQILKNDILKRFRANHTRRILLQKEKVLKMRLFIAHINLIHILKVLLSGFQARRKIVLHKFLRLISGKRLLNKYLSQIKKQGNNYILRETNRVRSWFTVSATPIIEAGLRHRAAALVKFFLTEKKDIFQIEIRLKLYMRRVVNIQNKWRSIFVKNEQQRVYVIQKMINYKNLLRDSIVMIPAAFKKYDWLVEDLLRIDYEVNNKNNLINKVAQEYLKQSSIIFQINIMRWHQLYSSKCTDAQFNLLATLLQRLENHMEAQFDIYP